MDTDIKRAEERLEYLSSAKDESKTEVVKNALKEGIAVDIISKITGKTISEIEEIKKLLN